MKRKHKIIGWLITVSIALVIIYFVDKYQEEIYNFVYAKCCKPMEK